MISKRWRINDDRASPQGPDVDRNLAPIDVEWCIAREVFRRQPSVAVRVVQEMRVTIANEDALADASRFEARDMGLNDLRAVALHGEMFVETNDTNRAISARVGMLVDAVEQGRGCATALHDRHALASEPHA